MSGAVLFSVARWINHGAVTVGTKALIIRFPLEKSLMLKPQTGPGVG